MCKRSVLIRGLLGFSSVFFTGMIVGAFLLNWAQQKRDFLVMQEKSDNYGVPNTVLDNNQKHSRLESQPVRTKKVPRGERKINANSKTLLQIIPNLNKSSILDSTPRHSSRKIKEAWRQYASNLPHDLTNKAAIAIVLDDLGLDQLRTKQVMKLPPPLTLALIPYGNHLQQHSLRARALGHEVIVHLPMEPINSKTNPGKNALLTTLTDEELQERVSWNLAQFSGFVGVNNHMGSKFTAWQPGMKIVMQALKKRGLLFLDSKTTTNTRGKFTAAKLGVPYAARDIFLDNKNDEKAIRRQLKRLEDVAQENGVAVGIGHPYDTTIRELRDWIPIAKKRGFSFIPVTAIIKKRHSNE